MFACLLLRNSFEPGSRNKPWSQNLNWLCSKVTFDLLALFISFLILAMATVGLKAGFWSSKIWSKTWNSKSWPSESLATVFECTNFNLRSSCCYWKMCTGYKWSKNNCFQSMSLLLLIGFLLEAARGQVEQHSVLKGMLLVLHTTLMQAIQCTHIILNCFASTVTKIQSRCSCSSLPAYNHNKG